MSHSKRNTSLAFFTSYERDQLRSTWGSQSARLNRDSFLPFGSCTLCLQPSRDPVACPGGPASSTRSPAGDINSKKRKLDDFTAGQADRRQCHVFCRECAMASLLAQKTTLRRLEREREQAALDSAEQDAHEDEEARLRAVEDFERVQMGLEAKYTAYGASSGRGGGEQQKRGEDAVPVQRRIAGPGPQAAGGDEAGIGGEDGNGADAETGRTFTLDEDSLLRIAQDDRSKARKALSDERTAAAKAKELPSFWVPALTPSSKGTLNAPASAGNEFAAEKRLQSFCPASMDDATHPLSLKTLIAVRFHEEAARGGDGKTRSCPACSKPLTNASRAVLAKPCGHVVCGTCIEKFVLGEEADELGRRASVTCFVCGEELTEVKRRKEKDGNKSKRKEKADRGLVEICAEGTGFASGGKNVVKKVGTAFQC